MDIAFLRYTTSEKRETQRKNLGTVLVHTIIVGITIGVPLYLFAPTIAHLVVQTAGPIETEITRLCTAILLLDTLSNHCFTYLRIRNRPMLFSAVKLGNVLLNIGLNVWFVGALHLSALGAFYAFIATSAVTLLVLLGITIKDIRPSWQWSTVKSWLAFGLPNLPSMLFIVAVEFSDRKWIELLLSEEQAGIYSAGYRVGMLMSMVAQAFRYAWQPFFLHTADDDDAKDTFARVLTYYIAFAGWMWLAASLLLGPLLKFPLPGGDYLIEQSYWKGLEVFPVIMLAHLFNGIYANLMPGIYIQKRTRIIPVIVGVAAVVNIAGNGLLIPKYGYWASAWLTVASYGLMALMLYLYINPKYPVPYEKNRIMRLVMTLGAAYGVGMSIPDGLNLPEFWDWMVKLAFVLAVPALWWSYILYDDERRMIRRKLFKERE